MYIDEKTPPSSTTPRTVIDNPKASEPAQPGWLRSNMVKIFAAVSTSGLAINGIKAAMGDQDAGAPINVIVDAVAKLGLPTALAIFAIWYAAEKIFPRWLATQERIAEKQAQANEERDRRAEESMKIMMEFAEARAERTADHFHNAVATIMHHRSKDGERIDNLADTVAQLVAPMHRLLQHFRIPLEPPAPFSRRPAPSAQPPAPPQKESA